MTGVLPTGSDGSRTGSALAMARHIPAHEVAALTRVEELFAVIILRTRMGPNRTWFSKSRSAEFPNMRCQRDQNSSCRNGFAEYVRVLSGEGVHGPTATVSIRGQGPASGCVRGLVTRACQTKGYGHFARRWRTKLSPPSCRATRPSSQRTRAGHD